MVGVIAAAAHTAHQSLMSLVALDHLGVPLSMCRTSSKHAQQFGHLGSGFRRESASQSVDRSTDLVSSGSGSGGRGPGRPGAASQLLAGSKAFRCDAGGLDRLSGTVCKV